MVSSISSKKWTKTRRIVVKTNSFVSFLEEFTAWQFAFEINWPLRRIKGSYLAVWSCCSFQWKKYFVYQIINVFCQLIIQCKMFYPQGNLKKIWTKYYFYQYCRIDNSAKNDVAVLIFISIFKVGWRMKQNTLSLSLNSNLSHLFR